MAVNLNRQEGNRPSTVNVNPLSSGGARGEGESAAVDLHLQPSPRLGPDGFLEDQPQCRGSLGPSAVSTPRGPPAWSSSLPHLIVWHCRELRADSTGRTPSPTAHEVRPEGGLPVAPL